MPFDFKVWMDWLVFRLDFMRYIGSHNKSQVSRYMTYMCVIDQTILREVISPA